MLMDSTAKETSDRTNSDAPTMTGGSRSIAEILERSRARQRRRTHTRAPGFVHGNCRVDSPYDVFGEQWVERTVFIERLPAGEQRSAGWTVARFDDGFLTLEQGLDDEVENLREWLEERLQPANRVIALEVGHDVQFGLDDDLFELIPVHSTRRRIQELEKDYLNLTRDRDFGDGASFSPSLRERLLESRLDVMTLVCLCAKMV